MSYFSFNRGTQSKQHIISSGGLEIIMCEFDEVTKSEAKRVIFRGSFADVSA